MSIIASLENLEYTKGILSLLLVRGCFVILILALGFSIQVYLVDSVGSIGGLCYNRNKLIESIN